MTYQDKMTLDEVAAVDLEMVRDAIKGSKRYHFLEIKKAVAFIGECVKSELAHLGLEPILDLNLYTTCGKGKGVKIERRRDYRGINIWRNGIYFYKDDVLVAFIGEILQEVQHPLLIQRGPLGFAVVTNVDVDRVRVIH